MSLKKIVASVVILISYSSNYYSLDSISYFPHYFEKILTPGFLKGDIKPHRLVIAQIEINDEMRSVFACMIPRGSDRITLMTLNEKDKVPLLFEVDKSKVVSFPTRKVLVDRGNISFNKDEELEIGEIVIIAYRMHRKKQLYWHFAQITAKEVCDKKNPNAREDFLYSCCLVGAPDYKMSNLPRMAIGRIVENYEAH